MHGSRSFTAERVHKSLQAPRVLRHSTPTFHRTFHEGDDLLFQKTLQNTHHVLQPYLPERSELCYNLRNRTHNKLLINKTSHLNDDDFIIRMLYKDSY